MGISYDPVRVRSVLPRAADWLLDGVWHIVDINRDELIDLVDLISVDEAVAVLESFFPAEAHRCLGDEDVAIIALALVVEHECDWPEFVLDALYSIDTEIGYYVT
jgi:hypothetical protein